MKKAPLILTTLTLFAGNVHAALVSIECKMWDGTPVAQVEMETPLELTQGMNFQTFKNDLRNKDLLSLQNIDLYNFASHDRARELSQAGVDVSYSERTGYVLRIDALQEESTDDYELDIGKGVVLEISEAFARYQVVGANQTEERIVLNTGLKIGEIRSADHGEDGDVPRDVACYISAAQ